MKKSIVTLLFAFASTALFAQAISQQEAKQRAESFLQKRIEAKPVVLNTNDDFRVSLGAKNAKAVTNTASDESPYYIFNAEDNQGYVIVSGDERAREILGYSETGNLSEETMPCGLRMLLDLYAQEIESLSDTPSLGTLTMQGSVLPAAKKAKAVRSDVATLMSCRWGQSSPYNGQCPSSGYGRCIVGCVATAISQTMYYWGHQKGYDLPSTAIPAYVTRNLGIQLSELPATTFDWASMKDAASSDAAAAKLCRYVGQAIEMDYGTGTSEAWGTDVAIVYRNYFGYDQHTRIVFRSDYDYDTFEQMIYEELFASRPVVVTGSYVNSGGSSWSGHSFVCDGYQSSTNKFHINWGWNGSSNGYFALSALNGSGSFDIYLNCAIGIQPPVEGNEYVEEESRAAIVDMNLVGSRTFVRNSMNNAFEGITIFNAVYNHMQHNVELVAGLGVYDKEGNLLEILDQAPLGFFERYDGFGLEFTFGNLSMGKDLEDGTYFIRSISKGTTASDTWGLSENANHNYITAIIADNKLTLQPSVDLEITSVSSGRATITNHGTKESRGLFYVFGSSRLSKVVQSNIAGGETKTVSLGTSSVSKVTADFDGHNVLWASSSTAQDIALTARAIDADEEGYFYGQTLLLDVSVTNDANTAYTTQVTVKLCKEGSTTAVATKSFTPKVEGKGIQTERLEFDGLTYNQPYTITLTSGNYTVQIGEMTTSQPRTFYTYTVTPIEHKVVLGDVNLDGEVTIADVTALVNIILGKDLDSKASLYNADANQDSDITIADVTSIVNIILNKQ